MKLQRNNKYTKKITSGIASAMLISILLSGCDTIEQVEKEPVEIEPTTPVTEVEATPIPTVVPDEPEFEIIEMKKLSDEEEAQQIEKLGIVADDEEYRYSKFYSIEFEDKNGEYRLMFATIGYGNEPDSYTFYDAFTTIPLFTYISSEADMHDNIIKSNIENIIYDQVSLFDGCTNLNTDVGPQLINNVIFQDIIIPDDLFLSYFPASFSTDEVLFTRNELGKVYVNLVPEQFRVTANDLELIYEEDEKVYTIG